MPLWSRDFARSRDKIKPLNPHYHSVYGHQTWQDGDLPSGASNHKFKQRFHYVGLAKPRDSQKALYLHYQSTYGHQTWQVSNLTWGAPIIKVTWFFDHLVLRDHVTNKNYYISTAIVPMAIKFGRMVAYLEGLLTTESRNALITLVLQSKVTTKIITTPVPERLWTPNLTGW